MALTGQKLCPRKLVTTILCIAKEKSKDMIKRIYEMKSGYISIVGTFFFIFFLIISWFFIRTPLRKVRSDYRSSSLEKIIVTNDSTERIYYIDYSGNITIAADLGYASKLTTKSANTELEEYFDVNGLPIARYSNYYAVLREYDEYGHNYRTTFLDANKEPIVTSDGYAIEERAFDEEGRIYSVQYLNEDKNPVCTPSYGYGKIYEYYEDGKIRKITYVNKSWLPMITKLGYASVVRYYYKTEEKNSGRVESEFYFDDKGKPISLSLGQFGVHKEYDDDGHVTLITYLDVEGNQLVTKRGYTTIVRTFHANDSIATERYYDIEGNPYKLSEGQYGIRRENGQTNYLDAEGREQFNIKNLLYNHANLVILFAMFIVALSNILDKKWNILLFALYIAVITYFTLMYRENGEFKADFSILSKLEGLFTNSGTCADVLKNIWLFMPLGTVLYRINRKAFMLMVPVVLSLVIEVVQYITRTGFCELMDVMSNGLGGIIGFGIGALFENIKRTCFAK